MQISRVDLIDQTIIKSFTLVYVSARAVCKVSSGRVYKTPFKGVYRYSRSIAEKNNLKGDI